MLHLSNRLLAAVMCVLGSGAATAQYATVVPNYFMLNQRADEFTSSADASISAAAAAPAMPVTVGSEPGPSPSGLSGVDDWSRAGGVLTGFFPCAQGRNILVEPDNYSPGHFKFTLGQQVFVMRPVPSRTGATRLEDAEQKLVWIQLANKSMLLDQVRGERVADECQCPSQAAMARHFAANPPRSLLE